MISSPAKTCSPWNPVMEKNAEPYAFVEIENDVDAHSWAWNPMNAAPMRNVSHTHRFIDAALPCLIRCAAICIVPLDAIRIDVERRRSASTLISEGAHGPLRARSV